MSNDLFGLDESTRCKVKQVLDQHHDIDEVVIYGSRAKGNYRPGSDIDISLKGEGLTLEKLNQIVHEIDDLDLPYRFDISIYQQIDNIELVEHIDRVGVLFE
jgi:predicted nucleotidyltransferase